ncbi:YdcF family protein [Azospirillum sp.]|uniref:YdcF family protein n=1 Tax=Azospirillum sp. TaxID=34012 RepID=UPI002D49DCAA|nr:YdcF family protein [Azospirillum sp.]HYF86374.1 YdcF family protein [Azospirillum sp.]
MDHRPAYAGVPSTAMGFAVLSFILSKLLWGVVAPGNALVLTVAVGALLLRTRRWQRAGKRMVTLAAVLLLLVTYTGLGALVALPLENRFPKAEPEGRIDGIIMLGGALNPPITADRGDPSLNDAAERILGFADLVRRHPDAKAVFTGGSGRLLGQEYKEDVTARAALAQAGIPGDRVIYEAQSRNTWENAVFSKDMVKPAPGERWVLVTSAMHMPRSVGIFRAVGWEVIPYPVDYRTRTGAKPYLRFEFGQNLVILDDAVREWIGLTAYWLMGRTEALFPAP